MPDRSLDWLADAAGGGEAYFVGGCVRDWLMGRPLKDIDLVITGDPWRVGQALADRLGAHLFWLRQEQGVARVLRPGRESFQVDLSPLRLSIEADLRARDFTVNAMGVPLSAGLCDGAPLLDPTGGREDLRRRLLRLVGPETLARDPLRLMRAFRLSEELGFRLEPETEARVRAAAPSLAAVSPERVRDELFLMLAGRYAARALDRLRAFGLLAVFLAETAALSTEAWSAVVARMKRLHALLHSRALPGPVRRRMRELVTAPRPRQALLKWAAVLAGIAATARTDPREPGAELARRSAAALRLSARESALLAALLREEETARVLWQHGASDGRALHRFVRAAGGWAIEAVIFVASDLPSIGDGAPGVLEDLLMGVAREEEALAAPLLSGSEVISLLGVPAGPTVGRWLDTLAEARAGGEVATPVEAREWLLRNALTAEAQQAPRNERESGADSVP
jgi:poly(A) polymerase